MTVEHRLTFEITDIRAVTLECNKCKGRFALDLVHVSTISEECPICNVTWYVKPTAGMKQAPCPLLDIVESIGKLRQPDNKDLKNVGFTLRFEFDDPRP